MASSSTNSKKQLPTIDLRKPKDIKPLDLLVFIGGDIVSDMIAKLETKKNGQCLATHVGLVVTDELLPKFGLEPRKLYVLEATFGYKIMGIGDGVEDAISGERKFGVQIRDLEAVTKAYITNEKTKVGWAKLKNNPWRKGNLMTRSAKRKELSQRFTDVYLKFRDRRFQLNVSMIFAVLFPSIRDSAKKFNKFLQKISDTTETSGPAGWVFCSQLVAEVYRHLDILPTEYQPEYIAPQDFLGGDIDGMQPLVEKPIYFIL